VSLRNSPIDPEWQRQIKASYPAIFKKCHEPPGAFMHEFGPRSALAVSPEERLAQHEWLWAEPGFKKWLANFYDIMMSGEANEDYAAFVRQKIRERIKDRVVAEKLVPKDHLFGSKRLPCESGYYEVYNRDNVLLVDVRDAPIKRITPTGIKTRDAEYALDVITFATGYDAVTGLLTRIDIRGTGGQTLKEKFAEGPRTYMGLQSAGFPNLFTMPGARAGNFTRGCEPLVDRVSDCIGYMRAKGLTRIEATPEAEEAWREHVAEAGAKLLRTRAKSWFVGANIPGKARVLLSSPDTAPVMRAKRAEVAPKGYAGFRLQ
jgi:cyclohexanone monooxygenase